jgi:ABC-2 type transport system permease protein
VTRMRAAGVVGACFRLEAIRAARSRQYQLLAIAIPVGLYLAVIVGGLDPWPAAGIGLASWRAQAMVAMATLGALGAGLVIGGSRLAGDRASGWLRTLALAPLPWPYLLLGRGAAGVALAGVPVVLLLVLGALLGGVALPPAAWPQLAASIWIGAVPFVLLGMIAGLAPGRRTGLALVMALYIGLGAAGGLVAGPRTPAPPAATIGWIEPSYVVGDLGWQAIRGQPPSPVDITLLVMQSLALGAAVAWLAPGIAGPPRRRRPAG